MLQQFAVLARNLAELGKMEMIRMMKEGKEKDSLCQEIKAFRPSSFYFLACIINADN